VNDAPGERSGGSGRPKRPRKSIPSARQLELRPSLILVRGLFGRCPACGGGHIFRRWFGMHDRCPTCTLRFERVEGHWIGSIGTNTVVIFGLMFVLMITTYLVSYPDTPGPWLLWTEVALALLGPVLFFPSARMLWTAIDVLMRPLKPGEIDPRYVRYDPYRDHPTGR